MAEPSLALRVRLFWAFHPKVPQSKQELRNLVQLRPLCLSSLFAFNQKALFSDQGESIWAATVQLFSLE